MKTLLKIVFLFHSLVLLDGIICILRKAAIAL